MVPIILIAAGTITFIVSAALLFRDCHPNYGSTMGGDMLAGVLWAFGSLFVAVGICLFGGAPVLWAIPSAIALYLLGIPCRRAVTWLGSGCGKSLPIQQSSGFAEHVKRTKVFNNGK